MRTYLLKLMLKHIMLTLLVCFLLMNPHLFAQTYVLYGDKTFGGSSGERYGNLVKTGDFSFIAGGSSGSNVSGDKILPICDSTNTNEIDNWVFETDTSFNIFWQWDFGGSLHEFATMFYSTNNNGNYIFSCISESDSSCSKSENNYNGAGTANYWIGMFNKNVGMLWDKTFGGTGDNYPQILQLPSYEYLVCGVSASPISGNKSVPNFGGQDYWCIKIDTVGNILWDKVYGGVSDERGEHPYYLDLVSSADGNIFLVGSSLSSQSGNITDINNGNYDILVIKMDTSGNIIWDKLIGGNFLDRSNDALLTNDNGLIICGTTTSQQGGDVSESPKGQSDIWVVQLDSLGNKQWDKRYGGTSTSYGVRILNCPDGGYWIGGYTKSDSLFDVSQPSYGDEDYWIIKIDSVGNKIWDKRFGGPGIDWLQDFIILADSSIILFGKAIEGISPVKTDYGKGGEDFWLVHFKYGNFTSNIPSITSQNQINVYPNPSSGIINLPKELMHSNLLVSDVSGRIILSLKDIKSTKINLEHIQKGCYLLQFRTDIGIYNTKWMKF